jgi:hypothetical protein
MVTILRRTATHILADLAGDDRAPRPPRIGARSLQLILLGDYPADVRAVRADIGRDEYIAPRTVQKYEDAVMRGIAHAIYLELRPLSELTPDYQETGVQMITREDGRSSAEPGRDRVFQRSAGLGQ